MTGVQVWALAVAIVSWAGATLFAVYALAHAWERLRLARARTDLRREAVARLTAQASDAMPGEHPPTSSR